MSEKNRVNVSLRDLEALCDSVEAQVSRISSVRDVLTVLALTDNTFDSTLANAISAVADQTAAIHDDLEKTAERLHELWKTERRVKHGDD